MEGNMKGTLIFRSKKRNEYSIELYFDCIRDYLKKDNNIDFFYVPCERYNSISNLYKNISSISKINSDFYHITGEVNFLGCFLPKGKYIITVHDYVNLRNLKGIKRFISWFFWDYIPLKRAAYIGCISETVCKETIEKFPFCKDKVFCAPNPLPDSYEKKQKIFNSEKPVILCMGTRENKNLERIIEAVATINCSLLIIGKLSSAQEQKLAKCKVEYVNKHDLTDDEIRQCYEQCDLLCFPSLFEGFGRPIIEANAIGRPVITSNIEPMIEVSNGAAKLVDPYNVSEIRNAVLKIINDPEYRNKLIDNGFINASKYSAKKIADTYTLWYAKI